MVAKPAWMLFLVLAAGCSGLDTEPVEAVPARSALLDDTSTVGKGAFELEAGAFVDSRFEEPAAEAALSWGPSDVTDLFVGFSASRRTYLPETDEDRPVYLGAGVRHRFADETERGPGALVGLVALFPAGEVSGREIDEPGAIVQLVLAESLAGIAFYPAYQLIVLAEHGRAGYDLTHGFGVLAGTWLGERSFTFAEGSAFLTPSLDREQLYFQVGGGWYATESLALDGGLIATSGYALVQAGDFSEKAAKKMSLAVIEIIDLFLIGTVAYITAVGLYKLFIGGPEIRLPMRLRIGSLKDLEDKIIGVLVAALAVAFLGQAAGKDEAEALLNYGGGIALVIAALAYFTSQGGKSKKTDSPDEE